MSDLTEAEIFDRMSESLRLAAEHCDNLAVDSVKGPIYENLRDELELIEGCCKQASQWREDMRWWPIGAQMAECHKRAGDWLRGYKIYGVRVAVAEKEKNLNFVVLAGLLRQVLKMVENLRTTKAPKLGMILPEPIKPFMREAGERQHRVQLPDGVVKTPGGLYVPQSAVA